MARSVSIESWRNDTSLVSVSGADPLNLVGILTPGPRLPALTGNRLLYEDGLPIATLAAGEIQVLNPPSHVDEWDLRLALLGRKPSTGAEEATPMTQQRSRHGNGARVARPTLLTKAD